MRETHFISKFQISNQRFIEFAQGPNNGNKLSKFIISIFCISFAFTMAAQPRLEVPHFPAKMDLSFVEKLYKSATYSMEVCQAGKSKFLPDDANSPK